MSTAGSWRWPWLQTLAFYMPSAVIAGFALMTMMRRTMTFDADGLWLFSFVHDIRAGTPLGGWVMPGAPLYFPELVSVFTWTSVRLSPGETLLVHGVISWVLLACTIAWALRLAGSRWPFALDAAFLALLLYMFAYGNSHLIAAFQFPVAHGGAALTSLIGLVFLGKGLRDGYCWQAGALGTACIGLSVASDRAVLAQFIAPAGLSVCVLFRSRRVQRAHLLWTIGILVSGAALGWAFTQSINVAAGIAPTPLAINPNWAATADTLSIIRDELLGLAHQQPLVLASVVLPSGLLLLTAVRGLISRDRDHAGSVDDRADLLRWWLAFAALMTMAGTFAGCLITHRWAPRYILPVLLLPLGFSMAAWAPQLEAIGCRAMRALQVGMLVVLAVLAADRSEEAAALTPYAPAHACLDRVAYQQRLTAGYADYWQARPAMVLGHSQLTISGVSGPLTPRRWMDNAFWYSRGYEPNAARPPRYDFVITNGMDEAWLESRFGVPRARERCFGLEIWIYDRQEDVEFRNFVRSRIARETGDRDGWWESSTLASARANGLQKLAFDGDKEQVFAFADAGAVHLLEISSPTQKPLDVSYQLQGQEIARQAIDFRLDTRRILPLPGPVVQRGLDSIRLHGLAGVRYEIDEITVMFDVGNEPALR